MNLSITKSIMSHQKLPKGALGSQRPNPSLEWRASIFCQCLETSTWVVQPRLETYHWIYNKYNKFDVKTQRDEQNLQKQKARNSAKTKLFWGTFLSHFEDKQWTPDCWPRRAPYRGFCGDEWTWISKSTPVVSHVSKPCKSICRTIYERLCDP